MIDTIDMIDTISSFVILIAPWQLSIFLSVSSIQFSHHCKEDGY